jgi:hypothetical protein
LGAPFTHELLLGRPHPSVMEMDPVPASPIVQTAETAAK